jgi:hypothetical protein
MSKFKIAALLAASLLGVSQSQAAPVTDTVQAPIGFFVPTDGQRFDSPYYRGLGENWGWTHGVIAGAIGSATLNISAFDVDAPPQVNFIGEIDKVYANDSGSWVYLGDLKGGNNIWAFSTFALGASFFDDINSGLQVKIDIDTTHEGWFVTLAKSSLSVDNGALPPPVPGIPEPGTYAMMLAGLAVVGSIARRRQPK